MVESKKRPPKASTTYDYEVSTIFYTSVRDLFILKI